MGITDTYTNAQARLGMITGSDEERNALQRDVFAAANRSRGNYADMANATAKMRLLAGDNFTSNQEALGFTELFAEVPKGIRRKPDRTGFGFPSAYPGNGRRKAARG